jgi:hypothetical protein
LNPVFSISSPGFQKSSSGFFKHESVFFSSSGLGFSRVRIFFESESGPGFEVCPFRMPFRLLLSPKYISVSTHRDKFVASVNVSMSGLQMILTTYN